TPTAPPRIYTRSLHDALPIYGRVGVQRAGVRPAGADALGPGRAAAGEHDHPAGRLADADIAPAAPADHDAAGRLGGRAHRQRPRSEEHTSELQSRRDLVCRLL